jgi:hypothetical protein
LVTHKQDRRTPQNKKRRQENTPIRREEKAPKGKIRVQKG